MLHEWARILRARMVMYSACFGDYFISLPILGWERRL